MSLFNKKLLEKLSDYRALKLIDSDSEFNLRQHLINENLNERNFGQYIFYVIGGIIMIFGMLLLIKYNWDYMPDIFRLTLGFVPLIGFLISGTYFFVAKNPPSYFHEIIPLVGVAGVISSIAVVSQVYHIEGDYLKFIFVVTCLSFPLVFIFNSGLASLSLICLFLNVGNSSFGYMSLFLCFITLSCVGYLLYHYVKGILDSYKLIALSLSILIVPFEMIVSLNLPSESYKYIPFTYTLTLAIFILFISGFAKRNSYHHNIILSVLSVGLMIFFSGIFSPSIRETHFENIIFEFINTQNIQAMILMSFLFCVYTIVLLKVVFNKDSIRPYVYLSLFPLFPLIMMFLNREINPQIISTIRISSEIFVLSAGLYFILDAMKRLSRLDMNFGVILISILLVTEFVSNVNSILFSAIGFLILGALFILLNRKLNTMKRKAIK